MAEKKKDEANTTVKVRPSTHQAIRLLAARLMTTNDRAVELAVRKALEELDKAEASGKG